LIAHPVVVGDDRNFISALVFLDAEMMPGWLSNRGMRADMTIEEAVTNSAVHDSIAQEIDRVNNKVSRAESIREFRLVPAVVSEENGYLSAKQSVKRHLVTNDFA